MISRRVTAGTIALAVISLFSVSLLYEHTTITTTLLCIISCALILIRPDRNEIIIYFSCGILGAMAEIAAIHRGSWSYAQPTFLGIPLWLPMLWGIASLFIMRMKELIDTVTSRKKINLKKTKIY